MQLRLGLARFVAAITAPLHTLIGDTWMRGRFETFAGAAPPAGAVALAAPAQVATETRRWRAERARARPASAGRQAAY